MLDLLGDILSGLDSLCWGSDSVAVSAWGLVKRLLVLLLLILLIAVIVCIARASWGWAAVNVGLVAGTATAIVCVHRLDR
ncbi:MAG TPA: hypothetical protein VEB22_05900 [Phycisphaerales bacterium]|nr:hypothetical protein [Phycisphaerales bacterium]